MPGTAPPSLGQEGMPQGGQWWESHRLVWGAAYGTGMGVRVVITAAHPPLLCSV